MNKRKLNAIKKELMKIANKDSNVEIEKVERYINLVEIYYMLDEAITEFGVMITTENGSQKFTKPNPAIAEKNKINASIIALGKDLGIDKPLNIQNVNSGNSNSKADLT
ncbi:P27 family phage terminase small subunit [Metasolibacillus meyeri]|uniref:P27 family phage terminase small subunit n=1 Tax=Metasolibacillus meyeri TaxID=1071052 RepID=UPI000D304E0A|nr:P27 family phage terminase small subunit [Metasolibacillus meyeri]